MYYEYLHTSPITIRVNLTLPNGNKAFLGTIKQEAEKTWLFETDFATTSSEVLIRPTLVGLKIAIENIW